MTRLQRSLVMAVLCLSGGIIFWLPFLRDIYYVPMQEAFGYSNTQMGVMASVFGAISLISYFPGGWLADRYSSRRLISAGLMGMGLGGLYFSSFPHYSASVILHAYWGFCGALLFWGAMIKATRDWGSAEEQGRAFGILEGGRGLTESISATVLLAIFAWLGSTAESLSQVIVLLSSFNIVLAGVAWVVLDDTVTSPDAVTDSADGLAAVKTVLKMPVVWLISIVILCSYTAAWGSYYFAPYSTEVFGFSAVAGGVIGVGKYWLKPFAALTAGFVADRVGVSTTVTAFLLACMLGFGVLASLPGGDAFVTTMVVTAVVISVSVFALRGIYFALLEEGDIPAAVTGTAVGVVSAIGFTPDIFVPLLGGVLLDAFPGEEGYRYFYTVISMFCAVGAAAAWMIHRDSTPVIPTAAAR